MRLGYLIEGVYSDCPGALQPVNISGSLTNTNVTLQWKLPENVLLDEEGYYNVRMQIFCVNVITVLVCL